MLSNTELRSRQSAKVICALLESEAWKAVLYLSPTEIVRGTRRYYASKRKPDPKRIEVLVSIGRPNYLEREFVRACQRAGQQFPVTKVQLKFRKYAARK